MKRFYKFLMSAVMIMALTVPWTARAQDTVMIGDGGTTTNSYLPMYTLYNNTLSEQIYTAEEIGTAGTITSIAFYNGGSEKSPLVKIYMVNTTQTEFTSTTDWLPVTAGDLVFQGNVTFSAGQWTTITLDSPFSYDGASNLGLVFDGNLQWSSGLACRVFSSTDNCAMYVYSDPTDYDAVGATYTASSRLSVKNQLILGIIPGEMSCYPVRNVTVSEIGPWSCTLNWIDTNNSGATYTIMDMADSSIVADGISDTFYDISDLLPDHTYMFGIYADCGGGDESGIARASVHTLVSCPPPTQLTVDTIGTDMFTFHWTPGYEETEWVIFIGDSIIIEGIADTFYTFEDLNPNTVYNISLLAVCGPEDSSIASTISVRTLAGLPISEFPYFCGFEIDEEEGTNEAIDWVLENGTQVNYWMVGDATANGGTQSLYITNNGSSNSYDITTNAYVFAYATFYFEAGEYAYSYDWKAQGESSYDFIRAAVVPADVEFTAGDYCGFNNTSAVPAGGIAIDGAYRLNLQSTWQNQFGTFTITDNGLYKMVFLWRNDLSGGTMPPAAIDNIQVVRNTCPAPVNLTALHVTSDSIIVSWQPIGEETSWLVSINGGEPESVTDTTYTFTELLPNTLYTIGVQADCGDEDVSFATTTTVRTECDIITVLPVTYNFDDQTTGSSAPFAYCWERINSAASNNYYPYIYSNSTYAHSGSNALYIYSYTSSSYPDEMLAILPPVDSNIYQVEDLELVFWAATSSSSYHPVFEVGVYVDNEDTAYFEPVDTVEVTYAAGVAEYSVIFNDYTGPNGRLAFRFLKSMMTATYSSCYLYVDDVTMREVNNCSTPANLTVNSATPDSVAVSWNETGEASSWQLAIGAPGFNPDTVETLINVTDTNYVFTNLAGGVTYELYVRSDCGDGFSYWLGPVQFSPGQYIIGTSGSATISMCGGIIYDDGGPNGSYSNNVDFTLTIYPSSPDSMLTFYGSAYTEGSIDYLRIYEGVGTDGTLLWQTSTSSQLDNIPLDTCVSGPITLKFHTDVSVVYSGFELHVNCVGAPECSPVENLSVHKTPTSALVTWQPGFYGEYTGATVEYKLDSVEDWTSLPMTTGNYVVINGLTPATDYNVRVTTDCDGFAGGVATANFSTSNFGCLVSDTTGSRTVTVGTGSTTSNYFPTNSCYNYSISEQVFTPLELGGGGNLVSFTMTPTSVVSATRTIEIYMGHVSSATLSGFVYPDDLTMVYSGSVNLTANAPFTFTLDEAFAYNGSDNLLVLFRDLTGSYVCSNYWAVHDGGVSGVSRYAYQDSGPYAIGYVGGTSSNLRNNTTFGFLACQEYGTCAAPAIAVTDVTTTTVTVAWAPGNGETSWNAYYRIAGTTTWSAPIAVTGNAYTFANLNSGTNYEFKLVNACSEGDFTNTAEAATLCAPITNLPYTEDFNSWGTGHLPNCWYNTGAYSTNSYSIINGSQNMTGATGGSVYMYSSSGSSNISRIILPELDTNVIQVNQTQLVFNVKYTSTSYGAPTFEVGVMSDPQNVTTFVPVDTVSVNGGINQWEVFEVSLANYTGDGANIAIQTLYPGTYFYCYLDDVSLEAIPTCPRPDSLMAMNSTTSSVDLSWNERGGATSWVIEYGPRGFELGTGNVVSAPSNPFTLTNIPSAYQGEFYVRSACSTTDAGEYSRRPCPFETTQIPATLPYHYDFEDAAEWANWQTSSNSATNNWYRGNAVADSGSYSMYISADAGATYTDYLYNAVVNAAAYRDIDFGPIDSSYTISFRARVGGTLDNSYDGLMVFLVDPSIATVASNNNITSPWGNVNDLYRFASVRIDTNWNTYEASFDTLSGVHRVAFFWFNQSTSSYANLSEPAAVDNIDIRYSSCVRPLELTTVATTGNTATLTWTGDPAANYEVTFRQTGSNNQVVLTNTNSITLTGLASAAEYRAWVRKVCGVGDTSLYSDGVIFATELCDGATIVATGDPDSTTSTSYNAPVNNYYNYTLSETIIDSAEIGGPMEISSIAYYYNYSEASTVKSSVNIWIQPTTRSSFASSSDMEALDTNNAVLVYSGNLNCSQGWNYFAFTNNYSYDGNANLLVIVDDNSGDYDGSSYTFRTMATTEYKTITWYSDSQDPDIDNIANGYSGNKGYYQYRPVMQLISCGEGCATPIVASTNVDIQTATITVSGTGLSYELQYGTDVSELSNTMTNTTGVFNITGLEPETQYFYAVRQQCDTNIWSNWYNGTFTTDELGCLAPTGLTVEETGYNSVELSWTAGNQETAWNVHVFSNTIDTIVTVTVANATIGGLEADMAYNASVRALCGSDSDIEGPWSDTVSFTTDACQATTGVTVTAGSTIASVSWTDMGSASYRVVWGDIPFNLADALGEQTVTTNSYTITGLDEETEYGVVVFNNCAAGLTVPSSTVTFSTTSGGVEPNVYTITAVANNAAWGTVTGGGQYVEGATVTLTATANDGYRFVQWTDGVQTASRTITVNGDATYTATFEAIPTYTVTVVSNNDAWGTVSGDGSYLEGQSVTITATPNDGYIFVNWSDADTNAVRTITVTNNITYIAYFVEEGTELVYHTVTVASNDTAMGVVTGGGSYLEGSNATLTAVAKPGYRFVQWNDNVTDNPRTVTVNEDMSFTATFEAIPTYTVTLSANNAAWGTVVGSGVYEAGTTVTISAEANAGYVFVNWSDNVTDRIRTFVINADVTLTANFAEESTPEAIEDVVAGTMSLYPNPATTSVTLALEGFEGDVRIDVVDMNGRTVRKANTTSSTVTLDVADLPQGAYFVRVVSGNRTAVSKLVVK